MQMWNQVVSDRAAEPLWDRVSACPEQRRRDPVAERSEARPLTLLVWDGHSCPSLLTLLLMLPLTLRLTPTLKSTPTAYHHQHEYS